MKIHVTDQALPELQNKVDLTGSDNLHIRIFVKAYGWGGPVLGVTLDEKQDSDYLEEQEGIKFVVDTDLVERYGGFEVDYSMSWFAKGFLVRPSYGPVSSC